MAARDQARRVRVIARKKGTQVKLYSRPGNDLSRRFPLIVDALARLRSRSCIIDAKPRLGLTWIVPGAIIAARTRLKK